MHALQDGAVVVGGGLGWGSGAARQGCACEKWRSPGRSEAEGSGLHAKHLPSKCEASGGAKHTLCQLCEGGRPVSPGFVKASLRASPPTLPRAPDPGRRGEPTACRPTAPSLRQQQHRQRQRRDVTPAGAATTPRCICKQLLGARRRAVGTRGPQSACKGALRRSPLPRTEAAPFSLPP